MTKTIRADERTSHLTDVKTAASDSCDPGTTPQGKSDFSLLRGRSETHPGLTHAVSHKAPPLTPLFSPITDTGPSKAIPTSIEPVKAVQNSTSETAISRPSSLHNRLLASSKMPKAAQPGKTTAADPGKRKSPPASPTTNSTAKKSNTKEQKIQSRNLGLPQRPEPKSPSPSAGSSCSGETYISSGSSSGSSMDIEDVNPPPNIQNSPTPASKITLDQPKTPSPPPIFISTSSWRLAAPLIFKNSDLCPSGITAKSASDGKINLRTLNPTQFRQVQNILLNNNITFHTHTLAADRQLKVVLKGIPTDITNDDLKIELESLNFEVNMIKRFGTENRPMPICMVILSGIHAKNIYEVSNLFYLKITVEAFKKSGPSQCHFCQRFGHGSQNCGYPPRCVKCSGAHKNTECSKTREETPTCANCNGPHTANFRGCPSYTLQVANSSTRTNNTNAIIPSVPFPTLPQPNSKIILQSNSATEPQTMDYSNAIKKTTQPKQSPSISTQKIITLLTELLSTLATSLDDPKTIITTTIVTFIKLLSINE